MPTFLTAFWTSLGVLAALATVALVWSCLFLAVAWLSVLPEAADTLARRIRRRARGPAPAPDTPPAVAATAEAAPPILPAEAPADAPPTPAPAAPEPARELVAVGEVAGA